MCACVPILLYLLIFFYAICQPILMIALSGVCVMDIVYGSVGGIFRETARELIVNVGGWRMEFVE